MQAITNHEFTREYFLAQICEFRKAMGEKGFWAKTVEIRDRAVKAISFVYFNTKAKDKEEQNFFAMVLDSTMQEYSRRGFMLDKET